MSGARAAVFLDRDGTLLDEDGYLDDPEGVRLLRGAARAVAELNDAGLATVLVTNQSGVARGMFDEERLAAVHARLAELLREKGAHLDLVLYCPHHPEHGAAPYRRTCDCRKPAPGLLLEAERTLGIDLARSWVVGDAARDLEAGRKAGVPNLVLVLTGKGSATATKLSPEERREVHVVADLPAAAALITAGT
jgi:D-glycero-D-manno-heptose 1,7-bisphosphate phosphatase